ncbi:MAG: hypothetical protein PQJ46_14610 [Spirochaetales bacterium]|nr:hypothetical protein [Spirochaetales bacterium]
MQREEKEPTIQDLNRRINRLELMIDSLIASEGIDSDDSFYYMRRLLKSRDNNQYDREFIDSLEDTLHFRRRLENSDFSNLSRDLSRRIIYVDGKLEYVSNINQENSSRIKKLENNSKIISHDLHHFLITQSLDIDSSKTKVSRFLPIRIYLSEDNEEHIRDIKKSMNELIQYIGFEYADDFPAEKGSWWKKWFAKSMDVLTQPEVVERLKKIEHGLEVYGSNKQQAENDKTHSEAVSNLIRSVENIPNVALQVGSILLVKITDEEKGSVIQSRTLTTNELMYLENNQSILKEPKNVLDLLCNDKNKQEIEMQ